MKIDNSLRDLAKEFEDARASLSGKRLIYSPELKRKAAKCLNTGIHPNTLAKELGISRSAIDTWKKAFPTESVSSVPKFIPLKPVPEIEPKECSATKLSNARLRITSIIIDVPVTSLNDALSETLSAIGVGQ